MLKELLENANETALTLLQTHMVDFLEILKSQALRESDKSELNWKIILMQFAWQVNQI